VVFGEGDVADVVVGLDRPVLAYQPGEVVGAGLGGGEVGDGVDGFAGDFLGPAVLPPSGDLDCLVRVRQAQIGDVGGLERA